MSDPAPEQDRIAALVDRVTINLLYEPFTLIAGVVGGMIASKVFARIWRTVAREEDAPGATDNARSWAVILPAAALHGVVFGVVKAVVDRVTAKEFERLTGRWPGKSSPAQTPFSADAQLGTAVLARSPSTTKPPAPMLSKRLTSFSRRSPYRLIRSPLRVHRPIRAEPAGQASGLGVASPASGEACKEPHH